MKIKNFKTPFGYLFEPCIEIWQIFLNFSQILSLENLKKHLVFKHF